MNKIHIPLLEILVQTLEGLMGVPIRNTIQTVTGMGTFYLRLVDHSHVQLDALYCFERGISYSVNILIYYLSKQDGL